MGLNEILNDASDQLRNDSFECEDYSLIQAVFILLIEDLTF